MALFYLIKKVESTAFFINAWQFDNFNWLLADNWKESVV